MAKWFKGRKAGEVRAFLEAYNFFLQNTRGDDTIYARAGYGYTVKIPARDNEEIPDGTMAQIRKCIRMCGIKNEGKEMLKWWKKNRY